MKGEGEVNGWVVEVKNIWWLVMRMRKKECSPARALGDSNGDEEGVQPAG